MQAIGRTDLMGPDYAHNHHRVARQEEIEAAICAWTSTRTVDEVEEVMRKAGVPVGRVNSVEDVLENEQLKARGAVREVPVSAVWGDINECEDEFQGSGWTVKMQGTFPVIDGVDPQPKWAGPELGAHTEEVLMQELMLSEREIGRLKEDGIIG